MYTALLREQTQAPLLREIKADLRHYAWSQTSGTQINQGEGQVESGQSV